MTADLRRLAFGQMQIGSARVDQHFEKLVDTVGHKSQMTPQICFMAGFCSARDTASSAEMSPAR